MCNNRFFLIPGGLKVRARPFICLQASKEMKSYMIYNRVLSVISPKNCSWEKADREPNFVMIVSSVFLISAAFYLFGLATFTPILGAWEQFHYHYLYGAVDPTISLRVAPRANAGGQGYALVEIGYWLSSVLGLSLFKFRSIMFIYSVVTVTGMIVVFTRWFGLVPAILGVSLSVFTLGFVVFSTQTLPMWPSLMLSVLFVERFQTYSSSPKAWWPKISLGILGALMLTHYALSRYFLVGWGMYFVIKETVDAYVSLEKKSQIIKKIKNVFVEFFIIFMMISLVFAAFSFKNANYLGHLNDLFFPANADEIEMRSSKILSTVLINIKIIFLSFTGFNGQHSVEYPDAMLAGRMYPLVYNFHTPIIILGFVVMIRRMFFRLNNGLMPYLPLAVIFLLTVGLPLFSEHIGPPPEWFVNSRLVSSYFGVSGLMVVAIAWLWEHVQNSTWKIKALITGVIVLNLMSVSYLVEEKKSWWNRVENRGQINEATGEFVNVPEPLPLGVERDDYIQARYIKIASLISSKFACKAKAANILIKINPSLLLVNGKYSALEYMLQYNDFSSMTALYLGQHNIQANYVIVYGVNDHGKFISGDGYAGKPRIFSGPIAWDKDKLYYQAEKPYAYALKGPPLNDHNMLISFSNEESVGIKKMLSESEASPLTEINIKTLSNFNHFGNCAS